MVQYHQLLRLVLEKGRFKPDRTGTGTYAVFGAQARFGLADGFPLVTTKKLHLKSIIHELLWFLRGDTNVNYLHEQGVSIWDEWADAGGNLGRIYGAQWCDWRTSDGRSINQIDEVIAQLKVNPDSRRLIVSAWNPGELDQMALPPATPCSNSSSWRANSVASSTSAAPTCSLACPSTSPPTHC